MNVTFTVSVELQRESGKFAERSEIVEYLSEAIEDAVGQGVDGVGADGDSVYIADDYTVEEVTVPRRKPKAQASDA